MSGQAVYSNVPPQMASSPAPIPVSASVSRGAPVQGYYAVNAPAPGTVGVASARINRAYNSGGGEPSGNEQHHRSMSPEMTLLVPGRTQVAKTSDAHEVYANKSSYDPPLTYIPPPPQPAHSYTPTSRLGVHMGAPQPLYSNTASQPIYKNTPLPTSSGGIYPPGTGVSDDETPPPLPNQPPPTYANSPQPPATNGATSPFTLHYANVLEAHRGKFYKYNIFFTLRRTIGKVFMYSISPSYFMHTSIWKVYSLKLEKKIIVIKLDYAFFRIPKLKYRIGF